MIKLDKTPTLICETLAKKQGKKIFMVPMFNKSRHAEILFNNDSIDAFVFENGKVIGGQGFKSKEKIKYTINTAKLFTALQNLGANIEEITSKFSDAVLKNVK